MDQIINPHDKFVKEIFTRSDATREFFENYMPGNIVNLLDLDSL